MNEFPGSGDPIRRRTIRLRRPNVKKAAPVYDRGPEGLEIAKRDAAIVSLRGSGWSIPRIAAELGIPTRDVSRVWAVAIESAYPAQDRQVAAAEEFAVLDAVIMACWEKAMIDGDSRAQRTILICTDQRARMKNLYAPQEIGHLGVTEQELLEQLEQVIDHGRPRALGMPIFDAEVIEDVE